MRPSSGGKPFSRASLTSGCPEPRNTGELNTPVADVSLKLQELKERYAREGEVSHLDGISVDAADWHFNVRPSNTEPLLRLNLEARSRELMERKRDEVLALIRS
jgi:phosphomannomutase